MLIAPCDSGCLHRLAIRELGCSGLSSNDSAKRRGSSSLTVSLCHQSSYLETVAGSAELIENTLSDFGVSGGDFHFRFLDSTFLFGRHFESNKFIVGEK